MPLESPQVDRSRIQGFGSEPAASADREATSGRRASPWDDILTTDILAAIGAASEDLSQVVSQMATNIRGELERVKSAFNCQAPEQATLSAEQIVLDHAVDQVKSVLLCGAPDKSDLAESEVVVDTEPTRDESDEKPQIWPDGPSCGDERGEAAPATNLLDLSPPETQPVLVEPSCVDTAAATSCEDPNDTSSVPIAADGGDLLDLSAPTPVSEENANEQSSRREVDLLDLSEPTPVLTSQQPCILSEPEVATPVEAPVIIPQAVDAEPQEPVAQLLDFSDVSQPAGQTQSVEIPAQPDAQLLPDLLD